MADDAVALLDHLGIERAHVVGPSTGGLVAQEIALRYAERVRSLTLASAWPHPGPLDQITQPTLVMAAAEATLPPAAGLARPGAGAAERAIRRELAGGPASSPSTATGSTRRCWLSSSWLGAASA